MRNKDVLSYPLRAVLSRQITQKDIITLRSGLTIMDVRALQALVLSQYRLKVFQDNRLTIKPVNAIQGGEDHGQ